MSEEQEQIESDYWDEARTPLSSLLFLLPLIAIYELGVLAMGQDQPDALRNGADFWMRSLLTRAGAEQVLLPVIVIGLLLGWHLLRKIRGAFGWKPSLECWLKVFCLLLCLWLWGNVTMSLFVRSCDRIRFPKAF